MTSSITSNSIKLMKGEVLLDTDNGGGKITANEVVDGVSNNLFPDVSELDRTYGRIGLRKSFASVNTTTTDSYLGAHAIVLKQPDDPNVSITMFTTKSWTDQRVAAANNIQSYLAKSVKWPGQVLGVQLAGQRSVQLLLRVGDSLPKVGQSLVLIQNEGLGSEFSQFVRVQNVATQTRQFTVLVGGQSVTFTGVMVTLTISAQLQYTFTGPDPSPLDLGSSAGAICRDTQVANAANYYGVADLIANVAPGDIAVQAKSIYSQLVPSAQSQTPLTNLSAAGTTNPAVQSGQANQTLTLVLSGPSYVYVPTSVMPGTWTLGPYSDDKQGNVIVTSSGTVVGTISYATNTVQFTQTPSTGTLTMSWMPAGVPILPQNTASIDINQTNRVNVFVMTLIPSPSPRRLQVSYMSQGNWYTMQDQGGSSTGSIKAADPSIGAGTIVYATGTVTITLGSLPDDASSILFTWASPANVFNRSNTAPPAPYVEFTITPPAGQQLVQSGLTITWPKLPSGTNTAALDPATQTFSGDGTGYARWANGQYLLRMAPNTITATGTVFTANYNLGTKKTAHFNAPLRDGSGNLSVSLPDTNVVAGTVKVTWNVLINDYSLISNIPAQMQYFRTDPYITAQDNGSGVLKRYNGDGTSTTVTNGAVNYVAGTVTFKPDVIVKIAQPLFQSNLIGYMKNANGIGIDRSDPVYQNTLQGIQYYDAAATYPNDTTGSVDVEYMTTSGSATQQTATMSQWGINLMYQYAETMVPGSTMFTWAGATYYDDLVGNLYSGFNPLTNAGTLSGSINYSTGLATITQWTSGGANSLSLKSMLTTQGNVPVDFASFRIPAAPVVPGSLQIQFSPVTGGSVSVTANADGSISGTNVLGLVNYQTGVVNLRFGKLVTAAGNESQVWYNAAAVTADGKIFKPYPAFASTIVFNAVAYSYLPLDASILGLDPVRLPTDGRVPIFQKGYVVVVHHTAKQVVTPANGTVVDVGRVRVAAMRVVDSSNPPVVMDPSMYTTNLDAGTLTFGPTVSTSGMTGTIYVENRVEDMAMASDVQITGRIALTKQLTHTYPAGEAKVSSALIMGDLQARMSLSFAQTTWASVFSDTVSGGSPSSNYNFASYPLVVTDQSAIQERWALVFTSSSSFNIIGEAVGNIGTGTINADTFPTNPATGQPYFTLKSNGWGGGWAIGNVLRFNTAGANYPLWLARTVLQSTATGQSDSFRLQIRGDIDA
ncbi:hypothetical protein LMG31506_00239 [Cupriavidus yeoncheonensis]|uniref:Curculin (Mannose-binding) lectin protein n=1 Tax=Cupriavidus yeoncheonensis TaxID=1462994 RepID=A0A916N229_9BURK|nr:hypothetical protein [Cupriavidus yeoncheonensis]CAG2126921.1 hypothetical protein LMG31506_00239 [Cupriavidus yeoncheonensis]